MSDRTGTFYSAEDSVESYGTQLLFGNGTSPEQYEALYGVTSIKPGKISTKDKDRTHLRSPNRHMEHGAGLRDSEPIAFEGRYKADEQSLSMAGGGTGAFQTGGLPAKHESQDIGNVKILASDGTYVIVRCYVSEFQLGEIEPNGDWSYSGALQPTQAYDHP